MKIIAPVLVMAAVALGASCNVSTTEVMPETMTYNFIITVDRAKQDMLLVGPEDEDIHIGVGGRKFYPTDETKERKDKWPEGMWTALMIPPDDPPRNWWDYELSLMGDGSVEFTEIDHHQAYDENLEPEGNPTSRTRLWLSGRWEWSDDKGILTLRE